MTREELKQEAKEYADKYGKSNFDLWDTARFAYYQGAEPREKQIEELTEQNTSLLISVENLNKSVQELEAQIEKMKCCGNCCVGDKVCYVRTQEHVNICPSWKLKEIKEK